MIRELRNRDMGEQSRASDAPFNGSARCGHLHDTVATGARLLAPYMTDYLECRINDLQLFGDIFTLRFQTAAAFRAGLFFGFQHTFFAGQMFGQRLAYRFVSRRDRCRLPLLSFAFLGD